MSVHKPLPRETLRASPFKERNALTLSASASSQKFVDPVTDGWMGPHLAHYLFGEYRHPNNTEEWLTFFEHLVHAYDVSEGNTTPPTTTVTRNGVEYEQPHGKAAISTLLTPEARRSMHTMIDEGKSNGEIRAEMARAFGAEIKSDYMCQLRRRYKAVNP